MSSLPAGVRPPPSTAPLASTATPYSDVADAVTETTAIPTLKVMRLQKPSLHTPTAGTISASSSLIQTAMCLPDSFGTISVGETFKAYLGALNTSRSKNVVELKIVAQLQTPSQRYQLVLKNKNKSFDSDNNNDNNDQGEDIESEGGGLNVDVVPPLECVDSIVSHGPLQEQGQHILRVEVSYVQVMGTTPSGGGGGGGSNFITQSTTTKSIRKFYRFQVTNPLSLGQEIWRRSDEDVFVSIEIKNTNNPAVEDSEGMTISSATFEPPPPSSSASSSDGDDGHDSGGIQVQRVTTTSSSSSSSMTAMDQNENSSSSDVSSALKLFDGCGRLDPGSSRRYLFHLTRRQLQRSSPTTTISTNRGIAAGDELGRPVFQWRKACGEMGIMKGPTLFCPDLPLKSLFNNAGSRNSTISPQSIMDGGHDGIGFVVYTHGGGSDDASSSRGGGNDGRGGSAVSIDVATKAAARLAGGPQLQSQRHMMMDPGADQQQQDLPLDEWLPVTVEPINPPSSIVVGVPTPISFMVVNHTEHPLSLQLQFLLEYMHGLAVCGPSFANLQDSIGGNGGTTTVEIRVICFQPGLAKLSGCSVLDLATGEQIPQLPQFHALVVPSKPDNN